MTVWSDTTARVAELERRRQQLDARLARMRAREALADKKRDDRRRFVAGGVLLSALEEGDGSWGLVARVLLDRRLTRPSDRALFGLD
jgi:type II secretory pathway component PulJ